MAKAIKASSSDEKRWQAEGDLQTLIEYAKICNDKSRLSAAMAMRKEKIAAMEVVATDMETKKAVK